MKKLLLVWAAFAAIYSAPALANDGPVTVKVGSTIGNQVQVRKVRFYAMDGSVQQYKFAPFLTGGGWQTFTLADWNNPAHCVRSVEIWWSTVTAPSDVHYEVVMGNYNPTSVNPMHMCAPGVGPAWGNQNVILLNNVGANDMGVGPNDPNVTYPYIRWGATYGHQ